MNKRLEAVVWSLWQTVSGVGKLFLSTNLSFPARPVLRDTRWAVQRTIDYIYERHIIPDGTVQPQKVLVSLSKVGYTGEPVGQGFTVLHTRTNKELREAVLDYVSAQRTDAVLFMRIMQESFPDDRRKAGSKVVPFYLWLPEQKKGPR